MKGYLQRGKLNVGFIDGQWGSSGKGKFNGTLALADTLNFAVSQNSVNASHIFAWDCGREYKFQHLPTSAVNDNVVCILGAGASIDLPQLLKEIEDWGLTPERLKIHPTAVVITPEDVEYEKEHLLRIASTMTGNGAAAARKVMRHPGTKIAADFPELKPFIRDTYSEIIDRLRAGQTGILETAQGFDLSMDHGMVFSDGDTVHRAYPYTTSRNVDPLTFAGMTGCPLRMLGNIFLNLRALPIRVGDGSNTVQDGLHADLDMSKSSSGAFYPDQEELTWDEVTEMSGSALDICEMTSLTKRKRRIFTFSDMQLRHITRIIQPHFITLNFVNYLDHSIIGAPRVMDRAQLYKRYPAVAELVARVEKNQYWAGGAHHAQVIALGTGPRQSDYIELVQ